MSMTQGASSITEVPLVHPCHAATPARFVVNDSNGSISRASQDVGAGPTSFYNAFTERLHGSASVSSSLWFGTQQFDVITSALIYEADVLSVTLCMKGVGPVGSIELDLGQEINHFSRPVKIQCFAHYFAEGSVDGNTGPSIKIVMVDVKGVILSLRLDLETLTPLQSTLQICSVPSLLESQNEEKGNDVYTEADLHSTMVVFNSSSVLILALSPYVVTVNIESNDIHVWSETRCLEGMKMKRAILGGILSKAGDILLGRVGDDFIDMPPTAALCMAHADTQSDSFDVFTLHSDASLRRWRMDASASLLPYEVTHLQLPEPAAGQTTLIASPSAWSPSHNSIALCARVYDSTYVLAIHIQTDGTDTMSSPSDKAQSNCKLVVLHGDQETGNVDLGVIQSSLVMAVPNAATSLVGMDFLPNVPRCSLRAVFHSSPVARHSVNSILMATYPPSMISAVSTQPVLIRPDHCLDGVAKLERDRIYSLSFSGVANDHSTGIIDDAIHELDKQCMQFLYRPSYPRGSGTVLAPSALSIRKVLGKLVPSREKLRDMSIELETLRAMHTWRKLENHGGAKFATTATSLYPMQKEMPVVTNSALSVYHSYMPPSAGNDGVVEKEGDMDDDEYETDEEELQRSTQLVAHGKRWKTFMLAVWDEEDTLRTPLCLALLPSDKALGEAFLVRAGVISVLAETVASKLPETFSTWGILDQAALEILDRVQSERDQSNRLYEVETNIWNLISKALLLMPSPAGEASKLQALSELRSIGAWSLGDDKQDAYKALNSTTRDTVQQYLGSMDSNEILKWLERSPASFGREAEITQTLPGLSLLASDSGAIRGDSSNALGNHVLPIEIRHAAGTLSVQCLSSIRRLHLSRCLLVLGFGQKVYSTESVQRAVFRAYLHSVSVLWTSSQQVTMPSSVLNNVGVVSPIGSPPTKRFSFREQASAGLVPAKSQFNGTKKTTALDAHMLHLSQKMGEGNNAPHSQLNAVVELSKAFLRSAFPADVVGCSGKPFSTLKELGALPPPTNESVPSDYPRLALRMLAPFVAYSPSDESKHTDRARREAAAECLLIESNVLSLSKASGELHKRELRQRACELLVPAIYDNGASDLDRIERAFDCLKNKVHALPRNLSQDGYAQQGNEEILSSALHSLLHEEGANTREDTGEDIRRLCHQHIMRSTFAPLLSAIPSASPSSFSSLGLDPTTLDDVRLLVRALLRLSNLMYRLSILERHMSTAGSMESVRAHNSSDLLLEYIENTIDELTHFLPPSVYRSMSEYATLWSMAFRHAMVGRRWKKAHFACANNPVMERKLSNYKRLVKGMVDAGALGELLELCSVVDGRITGEETMIIEGDSDSNFQSDGVTDCIDMYEVAAETLAEAYRVSVSQDAVDYRGCLYALHAWLGHWKRGSQAMNMRYLTSVTGLESAKGLKEDLAIEDICLAAIGSLHAILLVDDSAQRFLVSGEFGAYPNLPLLMGIVGKESPSSIRNNKRGRGEQQTGHDITDVKDSEPTDRLNNFLTVTDLKRRSVKAIALRIIHLDGATSSFSSSLFSSKSLSVDSDRDVIDKLINLGYYEPTVLLSWAMKSTYKERTGGCRLNGRDLFYDSVSYMLCSYVTPVAVRASRPQPGETNVDNMASMIADRPTYAQLLNAVDETQTSCKSISSFVGETWRDRSFLPQKVKGIVAMDLLQKVTCIETDASCPIALEVAESVLDLDSGESRLPSWLEHLLMGIVANEHIQNKGLFAKCPKPADDLLVLSNAYRGDPAGLVRLYIKKGMYVDACHVVSTMLLGTESAFVAESPRRTLASSRLPEKGDIDFVPYATIDVLWNLIDRVLQSSMSNRKEMARMAKAQATMESALALHFNLIKISDMGVRSARALAK